MTYRGFWKPPAHRSAAQVSVEVAPRLLSLAAVKASNKRDLRLELTFARHESDPNQVVANR